MNTGNNYDEMQGIVAHTAIRHSKHYPSAITLTTVKHRQIWWRRLDRFPTALRNEEPPGFGAAQMLRKPLKSQQIDGFDEPQPDF
jgi:hypothetical protein